MSKELYMQATEELIEEYMMAHPNASWSEAYEASADTAYERMKDKYADMIDAAKDRAKSAGKWPPKPMERAET